MAKYVIAIASILLAFGAIIGYTDNYLVSYPFFVFVFILLLDKYIVKIIAPFSGSLSKLISKFKLNHDIALSFTAGAFIGFTIAKVERYEIVLLVIGLLGIGYVFFDIFKKIQISRELDSSKN